MRKSIYFNDIRITKLDSQGISDFFEELSTSGISLHLLAASSIVAAQRDEGLIEVYNSGISLCDSRPLARILRVRNPEFTNIRGSDLLREVIKNDDGSKRHFFITPNLEIYNALERYASQENSKFVICGKIVPEYLGDFSAKYQIWQKEIAQAKANYIWIGLGSPKQDYIANGLSQATGLFCIAIGAAMEFVSGERREAPRLVQSLYLEWLFRLFSDPRRLFARYKIGNMIFLWSGLRYLSKGKKAQQNDC